MDNQTLLDTIRRIWQGPGTTILGTDDINLLAYADQVLAEEIVPEIVDLYEEYLIVEAEVPLVSTQNQYPIPKRAAGSQIRAISVDTGGTRFGDVEWVNLTDQNRFSDSGRGDIAYLQGDYIVLLGEPQGNMRIQFPLQPGKLILSDNYRTITSVNPLTRTVALDQNILSDWTNATRFDIHNTDHAGQPKMLDAAVTTVGPTQLIFSGEIDGSDFGTHAVEVGDFVMETGNAAAPQIPTMLHGLLAYGTAIRIADTQGDADLITMLERRYNGNLRRLKQFLDRRQDQKHVLINYNSRFRRGRLFGVRRRRLF